MIHSHSKICRVKQLCCAGTMVRALALALTCSLALYGQTLKRCRAESFYTVLSSNTVGKGNIWFTGTAIGHVWDDVPIRSDTTGRAFEGLWVSNARAFPEGKIQAGITEFFTATLESRVLTWAFKVPGFVAASARFTIPNNKNLRLFGFGLDVKYQYNFTNGPPTLGGYAGFMPEGYVAKGSVIESRFLFEEDLISKISTLPLRGLLNVGVRLPQGEYSDHFQYLFDAGVMFSGYDYDFFAAYSIEAFNNLADPVIFKDGTKRFVMWWSENPMYLTIGGNVRYENGVKLTIAAPLLLTQNQRSAMNDHDRLALQRYSPEHYRLFPYEWSHNIKDPFDPWYVKWKITAAISFPLRYTMTSAEMMRNFLLLKNTKQRNRLDIDNRLRNFERPPAPIQAPVNENSDSDDDEKRLKEIEKRKEEMKKEQ